MARIGRRFKGKKKSPSKVNISTTSGDTHPTSSKRQRVNYKRQGSTPTLKEAHFEKHRSCTTANGKSFMFAIYYFYVEHLDAPNEEHWNGRDGTVSLIRKLLGLPPHTRKKIRRTLESIIRCIRSGKQFEGKYEKNAGRHVLIEPGSFEEELIANWMQSHAGFRMTTLLVNEHRREEGKEEVSTSAVMSAFYRLEPKISIIEKVQSGGTNQGWIDASYNVAKQMQIMLGKLSDDDIMTDNKGKVTQ